MSKQESDSELARAIDLKYRLLARAMIQQGKIEKLWARKQSGEFSPVPRPEMLDCEQAAKLLDTHARTIARYCEQDRFDEARKIDNKWHIPLTSVCGRRAIC